MRQTTKRTAVVAKKLRKSPAVAKKKAATPKKAVQALQDELSSLLARGYSVEEVGEVLRGAGIEISASSLKGYARGLAVATKPAAPAAKKKATAGKSATRSASTSGTSVATASRKIPSPPPASAKTRAAAAKNPAASKGKFPDFQMAKATFIVRPDTPDSDL